MKGVSGGIGPMSCLRSWRIKCLKDINSRAAPSQIVPEAGSAGGGLCVMVVTVGAIGPESDSCFGQRYADPGSLKTFSRQLQTGHKATAVSRLPVVSAPVVKRSIAVRLISLCAPTPLK